VITGNQTRFKLIQIILSCLVSYLIGQDEKSTIPVFKENVDTVFIKVAVTDSSNRYVTGLKKTDFRVYEDGVLQPISHFSRESTPISMGFVMDVSYSMKRNLRWHKAEDWFAKIVNRDRLHPEDEYFLITFNQQVRLVRSFSDEITELENDVAMQQPSGDTALLDAIYWGIHVSEESRHDKKALILITDGDDNKSRYSRAEVREYALESDVKIYILPTDSFGRSFLEELANLTGGRVTGIESIEQIHKELRNQYLLGYVPTNKTRDGGWRRIIVKLDTPPDFPKLYIRTRSGYYAPED
jgi:Ca-activated chloride channel family protein